MKANSDPLTEEQRKLVEDNHNFIFWFLRKNNYEIDEWYGDAAIGMCKAARAFEPSLDIKFDTLATHCMQNEIWMGMHILKRQRDNCISLCSLNAAIAGGAELQDVIPDTRNNIEDAAFEISWGAIFSNLTEREKIIVRLKISGKNQAEIGEIIGVNQSFVSKLLLKIKDKIIEAGA